MEFDYYEIAILLAFFGYGLYTMYKKGFELGVGQGTEATLVQLEKMNIIETIIDPKTKLEIIRPKIDYTKIQKPKRVRKTIKDEDK